MHRVAFAGQYNVRGRTRSESEIDLSYIHSLCRGGKGGVTLVINNGF